MTCAGLPGDVVHVFPAHNIGKHAWRMAIQMSRYQSGARVLEYYWRPLGSSQPWRPCLQWPTYNSDDGQTAGLPISLRKYWEEHREAISCWIEHGRAPRSSEVAQPSLFEEA